MALGDSDPVNEEQEKEYAASHIIFVEICPYASKRFALQPQSIRELVGTEVGFRLATDVLHLLVDEAAPVSADEKMVVMNDSHGGPA